MLFEKKNQTKIIKNRLFTNDKGNFVKVVSIVKKSNIVNVYNYSTFMNETIEYDTAVYYLTPIFKIGEVARILDRKPDTLRKYEVSGRIPKASQISTNVDGTASMRVYTLRDVNDLVDILSMVNKAGRPKGHSYVNEVDALKKINARFNIIKNIGV